MADITDPKLRRLHDYWAIRRGSRKMPARADLEALEMAFAMGNIILVDVLPGTPPLFRIRLHGTTLVDRVGFDLTGKMLDEMKETEFREMSRRSFIKVVRTGEPLHATADRAIDGRSARYESIIMPLSDDGERVDKLLIGLVYDDDRG
jgi:hypothetical protein